MVTDQDICAGMLPRVSRTFALSIDALPDGLREAVRVAYLLCRVVDTVEDGVGIALDDRRLLFGLFDEAMRVRGADLRAFEACATRCMDAVDAAQRDLCTRAGVVFRCFDGLAGAQREAIRPHVQEMSKGMLEYVARSDGARRQGFRDLADLERYCYFVAGTVGQLLTELFCQEIALHDSHTRSALDARAVSFGLGLQMVNVLKDVADDLARGACYLPLSVAPGLTFDTLLEPEAREAAMGVVRTVCTAARGHLSDAREYTRLWPLPEGLPVRLFCAVPLALALATLDEVEHGTDTLRPGRNPKVSRGRVADILGDAQRAVASNEALDSFFERPRGDGPAR